MKLLLFIVGFLLFFPLPSFAEEVFVFHFEISQGTFILRSGNEPPIERKNDPNFSIVSFLKEQSESGKYRIDLYDVTEAHFGTFYFTPSNPTSFSLTIPYFGIAKRYTIYSVEDETLLLDGNLESFVSCNNNGICEYEKKETLDSCLSDCGSRAVYSAQTKEMLKVKNSFLEDQWKEVRTDIQTIPTQTVTFPSSIFIAAVCIIFIGVFGGMFFLIWKVMRK